MKKSSAIANKSEKGFSLLELMISIVIFLIAIAAVYQVMRIGTIQRNTIGTRSDANKGARIALNYIRRDVINAGLSYHSTGGLIPDNYADNKLFTNDVDDAAADGDSEQDFLTSIIAGNNIKTNILDNKVKTDSIAFVTRDLSFNNGKTINFTSATASGSTVVVKTPSRGTTDVCKKYDLYLFVESETRQVIGMVTEVPDNTTLHLAFGDPIGVNLAANGTGTARSLLIGTKGTLKKINLTSYNVNADGVLVRKTFGNQTDKTAAEQIRVSELIYNVKNLQIKYLLASGTSTDDPSGGNNGRDNQQKMNEVIGIEATLTVTQENNSLPQSKGDTVIKEVISTRNLHYNG